VNYLLDTNVVSEWVKPKPEPSVVEWLAQVDEDRVFLSVVTLAELRDGIERLSAGHRRRRLDEWLRFDLRERFERRILPVDERVADRRGEIVARRTKAGRPMSAMDGLIAATADVHQLTLVTRNVADFESTVSTVCDPWHP
jgi:predicted nucleic acid-binding protein